MQALEKILSIILGLLSSPADTGHTGSATNLDVDIELPATPGKSHRLLTVSWSYSDDPTGGTITVFDGDNPVYQVDVTSGGPGFLPVMLTGSPGNAMLVTLSPGGAGVVGRLNIQALEA